VPSSAPTTATDSMLDEYLRTCTRPNLRRRNL
jgi:hypothetical protein